MNDAGLPGEAVRSIVRRALAEDLPWGDVTSEAVIPPGVEAAGRFIGREAGIVCGLPVAAAVFAELDGTVVFRPCVPDGTPIEAGAILAEVDGPARAILAGGQSARVLNQFLVPRTNIWTASAAFSAAQR